MANGLVSVKLTWDDNSSGALDETGQEIDIWTDSPSFVPNVPINYTEARHPWMRIPPIAAARESDAYNLDPKMIDAANGDYRLRYDSALRGAAKHAENFARSYRGRSTKTRHLGIGAYVTNSLITAGTRGMDQWT